MLPITMDPSHGAVRASTEIAAAPEEVFRALTDPEQLALWWDPAHAGDAREWRVDPRPGGRWSVRTTDARGEEETIEGEYLVVDPPRRLEYTWRTGRDARASVVRVELAPARVYGAPGTRVTVTHGGFAPVTACLAAGATQGGAAHDFSWTRALARLAGVAGIAGVAGRSTRLRVDVRHPAPFGRRTV